MHAILEDTTMFRSCRRALRLLFTATPFLAAQDFFFQAEDGIRDGTVIGVQTCALPIYLLRKDDLTRIGARLPADSSALLTFAETSDPRSLVKATTGHEPATASVAGIGDDLAAHVFNGATDPIEQPARPAGAEATPNESALTSMILLRYPDPETARQVASRAAPTGKK